MIKKISLLFIAGGFLFIACAGWQKLKMDADQKYALRKAEKVVHSEHKQGSFHPVRGEVVGTLEIPALKRKLPIVEGASPEDLEKGVGHYSASAYPKQHNQIVLSGHRDTVFRQIGTLKKGDQLIIRLSYGSFSYTIRRMKIVDKDDRSVIHSTAPTEELVLTTCYPFRYVGNAPKRYIIYAYPEHSQGGDGK